MYKILYLAKKLWAQAIYSVFEYDVTKTLITH